MRTVIQAKGDQIQVVHEVLAKNPDGNAAQRKRLLKAGWKPYWRKSEKSALRSSVTDFGWNEGNTEEGRTIAEENEMTAEIHRHYAAAAVREIEEHLSRFSISEQRPVPCPVCGSDWDDVDTKKALDVMAREGWVST